MATALIARDDSPSAEHAVALLLRAIGEDPDREGLQRTPERFAGAMELMTSGASKTAMDAVSGAIFSTPSDTLVLVENIEFWSLCERHLLPFHGHAHVAYLPAGRVIGTSRLPHLVDVFARRLQIQGRLTDQIARGVQQAIGPRGVAVRLEARHVCMTVRGIERRESVTMTSSFLGAFERDMSLRHRLFPAQSAGPGPGARPQCPRDEPPSRRPAAAPHGTYPRGVEPGRRSANGDGT